MLYRDMGQTGDKVSALGYGCLRFPRVNGRIDEARTERQVVSAIDRGVNYFDTAYMYSGSEEMLGKILAKGYRDRVLIATKLLPVRVHSVRDMEATLETQLRRLQTDHIDYYLMHALGSLEGWQRLKQAGIVEFLEQVQREGKISRIGFSYHGGRGEFKNLVDDYDWDFCQIQYNYMDESNQAGRDGLEYAAAKGLGVVVMEPLRGGLLGAKMPDAVKAVWESTSSRQSPAECALRWVWDHPGVSCVLSGMNEEAHIEENLRVAETALPNSMGPDERALVAKARSGLAAIMKVGCTGCGYCMPCPAGVNIPFCFENYNNKYAFPGGNAQRSYFIYTVGADGGRPSHASLCRKCGKCEKACPQGLPIVMHLADVVNDMESWYFRPAVRLVQGYYGVRRRLTRRKPGGAGATHA